MTPSIKPLGQVQLGTGLTTIYTCPSQPINAVTVITNLWVCNTDGAQRTYTIRFGTGTLTVANSLFEGHVIAANDSLALLGQGGSVLTMSAGQKLQGLSDSASKVTVTVSGEEIL